ncbi:hypothetical protein [Streptomyces sp. NPDC088270]|uniref:hypothetical protein n=1 Tax=unclassified Streptomyces TaxID=2593676 RepID=UPI00342DAA77
MSIDDAGEGAGRAVKAAAEALGDSLSDPVGLGHRSTVLRCRSARYGTVLVKAYSERTAFVTEASALALGAGGPELLAVDADHPLVVMADLGQGPSLADVLLGDDAEAAEERLLAWARELGKVAVRGADRQREYDGTRRGYDPSAVAQTAKDAASVRFLRRLPSVLADAGLTPPKGLADDLAEIGALVGDAYPGLTPGDTCPDNNLITPSGVRLLDFEAAGYPSVFLTAAYCRIPFPTCWCSFRIEPALASRAEEAYRGELLAIHPDLADDGIWHAGVRRALAAWATKLMFVFPDAMNADRVRNSRGGPSTTVRQLLRHQCEVLHRELTAAGDLEALAETAALVLRGTERWQTPPLPPYPAFA